MFAVWFTLVPLSAGPGRPPPPMRAANAGCRNVGGVFPLGAPLGGAGRPTGERASAGAARRRGAGGYAGPVAVGRGPAGEPGRTRPFAGAAGQPDRDGPA